MVTFDFGSSTKEQRDDESVISLRVTLSWPNTSGTGLLVSAQQPIPDGTSLGAVGGVTRMSTVIGFRTERNGSGVQVQVLYHEGS